MTSMKCRLCGGNVKPIFKKTMLEKYLISYYSCEQCNSQQTEPPYWLDEAYAVPGVHIDVGTASRSLKNWLGATSLLNQLNFDRNQKYVDFGSGVGLFARLMRDVGYDFKTNDKYLVPTLTNYFLSNDFQNAKVITAFEVFEHLPNPRDTLTGLLTADSDLILFTTWFCDNQPEDWIYYLPECGQHVFFYSEKAIREFAARFGYELILTHFFMVLAKTSRLTENQREVIQNFSLNSREQVLDVAGDIIDSVIMGNDHIDRDLDQARKRFIKEIKGQ